MKETNVIVIGGVKLVIGNNATKEVGKELKMLGVRKVFLVTDKGIMHLGLHQNALDSLVNEKIDVEIYDGVPSDPPTEVVKEGSEKLKVANCQAVLAIGGGSVMDAAKAINLMSTNDGDILDYDNSPTGGKKFINDGLPLLCIPTTSGTGSEVTQYSVITSVKENRKATIGDSKLVSKIAFLDPLMTVGLPKKITAFTGLDALAHAVEAYTSNRVITASGSTVFSDTYALKAIELISQNLKQVYSQGGVVEARKQVMLGSTLAGFISQAGSGAAHGLGTPLGAHYHVPHGEAVGMMLPYVMQFNLNACLERYKNIAIAMGRNVENMSLEDAAYESVKAMQSLLTATSFTCLRNYVKDEKAIEVLAKDAAVEKCCKINAIEVGEEEAKMLYRQAWNKE